MDKNSAQMSQNSAQMLKILGTEVKKLDTDG